MSITHLPDQGQLWDHTGHEAITVDFSKVLGTNAIDGLKMNQGMVVDDLIHDLDRDQECHICLLDLGRVEKPNFALGIKCVVFD